jgi:hypothetical protein
MAVTLQSFLSRFILPFVIKIRQKNKWHILKVVYLFQNGLILRLGGYLAYYLVKL